MVLRKSFYIRWSAGRSPRVHEVNPGRDPSESLALEVSLVRLVQILHLILFLFLCSKSMIARGINFFHYKLKIFQ